MKKTVLGSRMQTEFWECLADAEKRQMRWIAAVLLGCDECTEALMDEARNEMRMAEVPAEFAARFATRVVVRLAIRRVQQVGRSSEPAGNGNAVPLSFLPWPERVALVLREVLEYSRRDTALLLSMTDQQVDRLLAMAQRRGATGLRSEIEEENSDAMLDSSQRAIPTLTKLRAPYERRAEVHEFPTPRFALEHISRAV